MNALIDPRRWSRKWRRAFVLTLPISGPLFLLWLIALGTLILVIGMPIMVLGMMLEAMWDWVREIWADTPSDNGLQ